MIHPTADGPLDGGPAEGPEAGSRRSFLTRTAALAGSAALVGSGLAAPAQAATTASIPNLYPGWNARNFSEIRKDENAHVAYLQSALGSNAYPQPQFKNLAIPANNPLQFIATSAIFENTGVGAYLAGGPLLTTPAFAQAGGILAVEAIHTGYLNSLINFPLVLNGETIALPFSLTGVLQNVAPYVVDTAFAQQLVAAIGPTPSAQNDIAIFRFALLLEYLEASYYNTNVPTFFGA